MKHLLTVLAAASLMLGACSTGKSGSDACDKTAQASLIGRWNIEKIVLSDTQSICIAKSDTIEPQTVRFLSDSSFSIQTNCNIIGGLYLVSGDSISLDKVLSTAMLCQDMETEEALVSILPQISTITFSGDSLVTLNASPSTFISLSKAAE